jgi:hypothetical protein
VTRDERDEFLKILHAHAQTIDVCDACAVTTRDLAAEILRGACPAARICAARSTRPRRCSRS